MKYLKAIGYTLACVWALIFGALMLYCAFTCGQWTQRMDTTESCDHGGGARLQAGFYACHFLSPEWLGAIPAYEPSLKLSTAIALKNAMQEQPK